MNLILRFLKPHWKLCLITIVLLIVDVGGALFIPTLVADMLNAGTSGATFDAIVRTGLYMAAVSVLAGVCAILGGYASATLAAQVGKDMREAIYGSLHLRKDGRWEGRVVIGYDEKGLPITKNVLAGRKTNARRSWHSSGKC